MLLKRASFATIVCAATIRRGLAPIRTKMQTAENGRQLRRLLNPRVIESIVPVLLHSVSISPDEEASVYTALGGKPK
ncbi:hypothetical protein F4782DRAFT_488639 [Xylaria castorea]|nr:hypothetical protein F4782DRAFT_488639 [Xylaria castorea]